MLTYLVEDHKVNTPNSLPVVFLISLGEVSEKVPEFGPPKAGPIRSGIGITIT